MDQKTLEQVYANQPELECSCGATTDGDDLDFKNMEYPDSAVVIYVYECMKCGKIIKETFARVKVEVSEI